MEGTPRRLAALLALVLGTGCASAPKNVPVVGRRVKVETNGEVKAVKGELLVVGSDRLWIRSSDGVREVPLSAVRRVSVKRHGFGAGRALQWAFLGGALTGGALAASCASVEGTSDCGSVGLVTAGAWFVVGGLVAPFAERSSFLEMTRPAPDTLKPFARLPQGLPEGVAPASLRERSTPPPQASPGTTPGSDVGSTALRSGRSNEVVPSRDR